MKKPEEVLYLNPLKLSGPEQKQRTSLPPSSSKPIKISLTSTTKYTQKQLQRNSMRMTTPKSVDYKLLSERQKSGDVLKAFKPIIFWQQCEESDEDGNETYDKDIETEAQLKQKLKWKGITIIHIYMNS